MAPVTFAGALMPKKKSDLQEISVALRISDQGTKEEILNRIKKHLERNPDLEDDPTFAGLFVNRRKRSVQPQNLPSSRTAETGKPASSSRSLSRRVIALEAVRESTPNGDLRDVSIYLKQPISPIDSTPDQSPRQVIPTTPSSLPPLPPSPSKSLIEHITQPPAVDVISKRLRENEMLQEGMKMWVSIRTFLSNSRNIWSATAVVELIYILCVVIPWKTHDIPLPFGKEPHVFSVPYPPMSVFQTYAFWMVLLNWAAPTLVIPAIVGNIISFNPPASQPTSDAPYPVVPFDPLTASIIRVATQVGYPFAYFEAKTNVQGLDVLGSRWRILTAAVGLAFAFAEAIAGAPQTFAKTLMTEQRHDRLLEGASITEGSSIRRRALMSADANDEDEVE
ncbi:hypothetical protein Hypma_009237 [Hypsizygus marmoreus]|uniref:SAP domain-containing protein n=1 Tax=Hypsizygus marmoreus TaxID=39966 RepID=A0A369JMP7_HYPMA|nr:hypothetical protein Hypma_009237 [Hypsizygus marmoreus]